jgi:dolichol-phosphate mannosyltransferase
VRALTSSPAGNQPIPLSIVIPCYNDATLEDCVNGVLSVEDDTLALEVIIVDDGSTDGSLRAAEGLANRVPGIVVLRHEKNQGKGAALRTGLTAATGEFVAVQNADLEHDPADLKRLLTPLVNGDADVVIGSRFISPGFHRVAYFWHFVGNRVLTTLSNMLTDLNLTDIDGGYMVFRREIVQSIQIEENRFGVEAELVAKIAQMRLRIYEMSVSYRGRAYAEGKKIALKDGWRTLYCILKHNLHSVPVGIQFLFYTLIGGVAAIVNLLVFLSMRHAEASVSASTLTAFFVAAAVNYYLSVKLLFRHKARWTTWTELAAFLGVVTTVAMVDLVCTRFFIGIGLADGAAKIASTGIGLVLNFIGRKYVVFPEKSDRDWEPQNIG